MPIGWPELLIILLVVVLLFGARKLPEAARSIGRSARIFKSEMNEMQNENAKKEIEKTPASQQETQAQQPHVQQPTQQPQVQQDRTPEQDA
ncbi:Sec-independent protein translocase subunit TatA [Corynebacterium ulceribovis]|uniref:Sec-independent protein translocase subunit TatA n=1 Tax=Corynebacterium ulceribovis TaxID=487732 RepID=UPI0003614E6A|nr:Sec-independent protein translocase subunit TatA [Corynebacterium ulceribovis]